MNIVELARALNISTATVSRALNNRPEVSAGTRRLVIAKAQELGYSPSASARQLVSGRNQLIRLECPRYPNALSDQYLLEVIRALEEPLRKRGYALIIRLDVNADELPPAGQHSVDGIVIIAEPGTTSSDIDEAAKLGELPVVVIGPPESVESRYASFVDVDTLPGVEEALNYLAALGHRNVGYIGSGYLGSLVSAEMPKLMASAGLDWSPALTIEAGVSRDDGREAALKQLSLRNRPTAIFTRTDVLAWGAMEAANSLGLEVPVDVSIIGHDNIKISSTLNPPLTTVAINITEVGRLAAESLIGMIEDHNPPSKQSSSSHLIIRRSCAAPK